MALLVLELHWRRGDVGCRAPPLDEKVKIVVESREKFLGWVTRGEESDSDVGVGVTWRFGSTASRNVVMLVKTWEKMLG